MLGKKQKEKVIKESQLHEADTGSPEVQISVLTQKIKKLASHLKKNRKDKHSRRGLLGMVSARRRHLSFLRKKDQKRYDTALSKIKDK